MCKNPFSFALVPESTAITSELILIVDDEENIIELGRLYLENEGYRVEAANDGLEALRKFDELRPALIVLDLIAAGT